jgi:acetolactate synthase-1/2/3 large subunit
VHLSLPSDLLEERVESNAIVWPNGRVASAPALPVPVADAVLAAIASAARPIILAPPQLSNVDGRALLARLEAATGAPAVILESPRGIADATLGAFQDLTRRADLIVLLGKALDFTTRWVSGQAFDPNVKLIAIDPEAALVERAAKEMDDRLLLGSIADVKSAAETLIDRAAQRPRMGGGWLNEARAALDNRPAAWGTVIAETPGTLHPAEVFRVLRPYVEHDPDTVLICDGGEFAQWAQSMLPVRRRMINGVGGSIGASLSFANAARLAEPTAPVFVVLGDGTIGFHISEFETAVRRNLPFVAILGNDALWNAESQIQLREYGKERMHGCDLLPTRYDLVVQGFGGHGELVERVEDLPGAIDRALASRKPACINIMIESMAAPVIRLG